MLCGTHLCSQSARNSELSLYTPGIFWHCQALLIFKEWRSFRCLLVGNGISVIGVHFGTSYSECHGLRIIFIQAWNFMAL